MTLNKLTFLLSIVAIILLIPFIAMQFSNEVKWTFYDFAIASALLISTGISCEYVWRKAKTTKMRFTLITVILAFLVLVWAELAVGIF